MEEWSRFANWQLANVAQNHPVLSALTSAPGFRFTRQNVIELIAAQDEKEQRSARDAKRLAERLADTSSTFGRKRQMAREDEPDEYEDSETALTVRQLLEAQTTEEIKTSKRTRRHGEGPRVTAHEEAHPARPADAALLSPVPLVLLLRW